jgi:hypothetical protein
MAAAAARSLWKRCTTGAFSWPGSHVALNSGCESFLLLVSFRVLHLTGGAEWLVACCRLLGRELLSPLVQDHLVDRDVCIVGAKVRP